MVKETSMKVFKQKNSKFEKKIFLTFLSPKGVAQGYPLARPPKRNLKIASVRPPKMSKDTSMQNFKPLGLVDVSGDILGSTFWLRSFNYEDSCKLFYQFKGKRTVLQHRMVNEALAQEIQDMHGLRIFTSLPSWPGLTPLTLQCLYRRRNDVCTCVWST